MVFWPQIDQEIHLRCRVGSDVSMNQLSQSQTLAGAQITLGPSNNQEKFKDSDANSSGFVWAQITLGPSHNQEELKDSKQNT